MLSSCLLPLSSASGSNLLQQSMAPAHADVLLVRSQNAERTTETLENTEAGQKEKSTSSFPGSEAVSIHGWWSTCPGNSDRNGL